MRGKQRKILKSKRSRRGMRRRPDYVFLAMTGLLIGAGLIALFSASALYGTERFGGAYYFLKRQIALGIGPGAALAILLYMVPLGMLKKTSALFFVGAIAASAAVLIPSLGVTVGGASRWLALGPIQFQPSEFLKIAYILYIGALLSGSRESAPIEKKSKGKRRGGMRDAGTLKTFLVISGITGLILVIQPDAGTLALILSVGGIMYFASGASFLTLGLLGGIMALTGAALAYTAPYRIERLLVFLDPRTDPLGIGYQINQILIAIGSGGLSGLGIGMSQQKFGFIPQPIGDSIFAIFAEEFGFIGAVALISLLILFIWRGLQIARFAPDKFAYLITVGVVAWIGTQSFINLGAMAGLLPLTGIPLPFFSYGGSAMASILAGVGIVLNVSKHS